jgi:hypothetical protein
MRQAVPITHLVSSRSSDFGFWLSSLGSLGSLCPAGLVAVIQPLTYEIRVNANLPEDGLQTGYGGRALRMR